MIELLDFVLKERKDKMSAVFANLFNIEWQQVVMWVIGGLLIYLAIKKEMEPTLLLPMGFGAILVNLPIPPIEETGGVVSGVRAVIDFLFEIGGSIVLP